MVSISMLEAVRTGSKTVLIITVLLVAAGTALAQEQVSVMLQQHRSDTISINRILKNTEGLRSEHTQSPKLGLSRQVKRAFFCELEDEGAKRSRIPMKFRLGDIEYVDWREGKRSGVYGLKPTQRDR